MRIQFGVELLPAILKEFIKASARTGDDSCEFCIYRTLRTARVKWLKYSRTTNSKLCVRAKFTFHLHRCELDGHWGHVVHMLELAFYEWESMVHSSYTVRNAALIHKAIRLLSLQSTQMGDHELYSVFFEPYFTNLPFGYRGPSLMRDNAFVSNIYFDEFLTVFTLDKTLSLTGFRFARLEKTLGLAEEVIYAKHTGNIAGLAKVPETVSNYYELNQLDLAVLPQEMIKYKLITSGHSKENPIAKMTNVRSLTYYLRRELAGLGVCDVKVEVYLTQYSPSQFKPYSAPGDIDISAGNIEMFYTAVATRTISALRFELARSGKLGGSIDLSDLNAESKPKSRYSTNTGLKDLGSFLHIPKPTAFSQSLMELPPTSVLSQTEQHPDMQGTQTPASNKDRSSKLILRTLFLSKLRSLRRGSNMPRKEPVLPKLFKDSESVMFFLKIVPSNSKIAKHKLILSSPDIVNMLDVRDFMINGLGKSRLDLEAIASVSTLDPKSIFGSLCGYICSKIIMRRWVIYRRPFVCYPHEHKGSTFLHQNDFMFSRDKTTPKLQPFLRVQAFDFELVYHRVHRYRNRYAVVSIVKKTKERVFSVNLYIQANCRVYSTRFKHTDLKDLIDHYLFDLLKSFLLIPVHALPASLNDVLQSISRHTNPISMKSETHLSPSEEFKFLESTRAVHRKGKGTEISLGINLEVEAKMKALFKKVKARSIILSRQHSHRSPSREIEDQLFVQPKNIYFRSPWSEQRGA